MKLAALKDSLARSSRHICTASSQALKAYLHSSAQLSLIGFDYYFQQCTHQRAYLHSYLNCPHAKTSRRSMAYGPPMGTEYLNNASEASYRSSTAKSASSSPKKASFGWFFSPFALDSRGFHYMLSRDVGTSGLIHSLLVVDPSCNSNTRKRQRGQAWGHQGAKERTMQAYYFNLV